MLLDASNFILDQSCIKSSNVDIYFNNISELLSFCWIFAPVNFALNFLEYALLKILKILQTSRQVCQLKDP